MAILSPSELLDWLGQNHFLTPAQTDELRPILPSFPESHALAKELIRRDWLTPFQVNQILIGKHEQLILDSYRLRERIGEGAMGQVFKAWHPLLARIVAIKMIHKELVDNPKIMNRFRREVEAAARLDHPNITKVRDAGDTDDRPYLVMDFIDGFNLSTHVKQHGPLPIHEAAEYVRQAAVGLQHAYEKNVVHRDIKPGNLLVTAVKSGGETTPIVKILDFGLARFDEEMDSADRLTEMGKLLGTIDYVAPEQANNARGADIRADIYSLGCTLFFLLTARPAFLGENIMEKLSPRMTGEPPWIRSVRPEISPGLEEVLRKMMARRPEDRYQTPIEVAQTLESFATPTAANRPVAMAMPIAADAVDANVPMAQPVGVSGPVVAPTPSTENEPEFLGMTATGRPMSTTSAPNKPAATTPTKPWPVRLFVVLAGGAVFLAMTACLICVLFYYFRDPPKRGEIVVAKWRYANPNGESKPGTNRVLINVQRVDFSGPVMVTLKRLPNGVSVSPVTIPPNKNEIELPFTVSFGTAPQVRQISLYLECPEHGIHTEVSIPLTIIDDPGKLKK